jgi:hypothetical protein
MYYQFMRRVGFRKIATESFLVDLNRNTHKKEVEKQQRVESKVMKLFKEYSASILSTSAKLSTYFSFNSSLLLPPTLIHHQLVSESVQSQKSRQVSR